MSNLSNKTDTENNKVGIITLYHANYNFGGLLQAYALPAALEKYIGVFAEQIDYSSSMQRQKNRLSIGEMIYKSGIAFFNALEKRNFKKRKKAFEEFSTITKEVFYF